MFESGPDKGKTIELVQDTAYSGGTDESCEIRINDELASPIHFKIKEKQGRYFILTPGKESTVLVNDTRVTRTELRFNDKIQVGATYLSFTRETRSDPLIGKTIEGYKIVDRLGRGGMGTVYLARQLSLNRDVAIKRLSPRLTRDVRFRERFIREARAAGAFNHPNVLQVYDVIDSSGFCFYSMEYIPGGTVEDLINKDRVPVDAALRIIREAANGLMYAEQKHIVHHDIKPQNLMITDLGSVKISDMGLACSLDDSTKDEGAGLIGTPHFISPERIQRKGTDIRSDIYSLGCTFYMILTGKTPFRGKNVKEILRKQINEEPAPLKEERPDAPDALCRIVQRMMAKKPDDRYKDSAELIKDLDEIKPSGKRWPLAAGAAALVVVLFAAYFLLNSQNGNGEKPEPYGDPVVNNSEKESQLKEEVADLQKRMQETKASNSYLSIPDGLLLGERIKELTKIIDGFPGTPTAIKAAEEKARIREKLDQEMEIERARLAKMETLQQQAGPAVEKLLSSKDFVSALEYAYSIGEEEGLLEEDVISSLRAGLVAKVKNTLVSESESVLKTAAEAAEKNDFTAARKALDDDGARFGPIDDKMREEVSSFLNTISERFIKAISSTAKAEREFFMTMYDDDLKNLFSSIDPCKVRSEVLGYGFPEATSTITSAVSLMRTESYKVHVAKLASGPAAAALLFTKLLQAVDNGALQKEEVTYFDEGKETGGAINSLTDERDGLKILITRGKKSSMSNVPFARFKSASQLITLIDDRFPMSAGDKLDLAEAAIHFEAARCAACLSLLNRAVEAYDPVDGWTAESVKSAASTPMFLDLEKEIERLSGEASALDSSLEERCAGIMKLHAEEAAAVKAFYAGADPFINSKTDIGFEEAERLLLEFTEKHSHTIFSWYISGLMNGSSVPEKHLVGFKR